MSVLDILLNPDRFFKRAKEEGMDFIKPLIVLVVAGILAAINGYVVAIPLEKAVIEFAINKGMSYDQATTMAKAAYFSSIIGSYIEVFITWFIISVILHIFSSIFSTEGELTTTLKFMAFSFIPYIVLFPLNLYISISRAEIIKNFGLEGLTSDAFSGIRMVSIFVGFAILIWQYALWTFAIKNVRNLTLRNAAIVAALPALAIVLLKLYSLLKSIS